MVFCPGSFRMAKTYLVSSRLIKAEGDYCHSSGTTFDVSFSLSHYFFISTVLYSSRERIVIRNFVHEERSIQIKYPSNTYKELLKCRLFIIKIATNLMKLEEVNVCYCLRSIKVVLGKYLI